MSRIWCYLSKRMASSVLLVSCPGHPILIRDLRHAPPVLLWLLLLLLLLLVLVLVLVLVLLLLLPVLFEPLVLLSFSYDRRHGELEEVAHANRRAANQLLRCNRISSRHTAVVASY